MSWHEIPRQSWSEYLRGFSSEHRDWQVTVEIRPAGGPTRVPFLRRPLREVRLEDDRVVVAVGDGEQAELAGPVRILVDETTVDHGRADRGLTVVGQDEALELQFRVVIPPEMVDGATD
jgi:hypothetical protein